MRPATIRTAAGHRAVRVDEDAAAAAGMGERRNTCRPEEAR
jgi:hypothetical protein